MINTADYRNAVNGEGPLAFTWQDKPHRLVYDLCQEVERLQDDLDAAEDDARRWELAYKDSPREE